MIWLRRLLRVWSSQKPATPRIAPTPCDCPSCALERLSVALLRDVIAWNETVLNTPPDRRPAEADRRTLH